MACPYFKPSRRLDAGGWDPAPRLPLGDAWGGECTAGVAWEPPEAIQREVCNCGYARGRCEHFPVDERADAVRFSSGAGERLIYILEKDHAPIEHWRNQQPDRVAGAAGELGASVLGEFTEGRRGGGFLGVPAGALRTNSAIRHHCYLPVFREAHHVHDEVPLGDGGDGRLGRLGQEDLGDTVAAREVHQSFGGVFAFENAGLDVQAARVFKVAVDGFARRPWASRPWRRGEERRRRNNRPSGNRRRGGPGGSTRRWRAIQ